MNETADAEKLRQARARLDRLAWLLDDSIRIPGTNRRFGIDPLIGLIPGAGDVVGAALSLWVVAEAARIGAPRALIWRMLGNVALEAVVGVIPLVGDLFDFVWKANSRNRQLLADHIDQQLTPAAPRSNWVWLILAALLALLLVLFYSQSASGPL